jgi:hypothetical protein
MAGWRAGWLVGWYKVVCKWSHNTLGWLQITSLLAVSVNPSSTCTRKKLCSTAKLGRLMFCWKISF